ncbi:139L [Invertebrate iridescent virus 6]|uniref:Uncharacterized protein 139L n=1 Tax=Invertebrate iridescent virus 6 TaxID=176652 RepID=139L_IIV6|nr:139L [Invertebrate iridescent virus 6]O55745.1 RecName: Full=Uncharacterized protein 139L; Flags: Precursor [Invertebrate iridescent virus 6]AAB94456.1 139L [Invertebrate iridescent virus 6]QMS79392.1 hypothetical protein IIV6-T1_143 [Invertebrate iridescent virus 6]
MKFIKLFTFLVYLFVTLTNVFAFPDGMMCLNLDGSVGGYGCVFRRVESPTTTTKNYCDYYYCEDD